MKIYTPDLPCKTGKGKFIHRLILELFSIGVAITNDPKSDVDIYLDKGKFHTDSNAKKKVLRLGPAHVDTNQHYKKLNSDKSKHVKMADAVVYQSEYSKKICEKYIYEHPGPTAIIHNGADPNFYKLIEPWKSKYKKNFLCAARVWVPQKRLKYSIKSFLNANVPDSCLFIAGEVTGKEKVYERDNVRFLGPLNDTDLGSLYRLCDAMIHITYLDACPNTVIEAMVAGCHVIATDQGGTKELTPDVVRDTPYDFEPIDLNNPPKADYAELSSRIANAEKRMDIPWASSFYINNIAQQYKTFFEKILV